MVWFHWYDIRWTEPRVSLVGDWLFDYLGFYLFFVTLSLFQMIFDTFCMTLLFFDSLYGFVGLLFNHAFQYVKLLFIYFY